MHVKSHFLLNLLNWCVFRYLLKNNFFVLEVPHDKWLEMHNIQENLHEFFLSFFPIE
ncbi:Uncharacterised protein [Candidatus Venteria ishoeyi]|uniref:Uncharacterized protein n=1 Tax=Candidatus Venteria ishoeyi TaxID=1899563 RepID=A0A1H6F4L1_9GAMM|nr:Uncharacterised protein [Candidatus Venteria ishoeyi]